MIERKDLLPAEAAKGLRIYQLTDDPTIPSCHVYMEAPVFTPDGQGMVLHQCAHPHGPDKDNPRHAYLSCNLAEGGSLRPLTPPEDFRCTSPAVAPDGKWFYYFVDETRIGGGRLTLKRVRMNGTAPEILTVIDNPVSGTRFRACKPYPLATISADGRHLALQVFLGDGYSRNSPFGLLVFDLEDGGVSLPIWGPTLLNCHAQYARTTDTERVYDLLIQENHESVTNANGALFYNKKPGMVDLHVLRDDGTNLRDIPLGRDERELCSGHQCWRGDSPWVVSSMIGIYGRGLIEGQDFRLVEALPVPHQGHRGSQSWWAQRNDLTPYGDSAGYNHFGIDRRGRHIVCENRDGDTVVFARLSAPGETPIEAFTVIAKTDMRQSMRATVDSHPFISPDGRRAFFNSNATGQLQAYMIDGLETLWNDSNVKE